MKSYDDLKALIIQRGVHPEFGDAGEGFAIEQNPHELATFLVRMQELGVASVLEIGTGHRGGLSKFLSHDMDWDVTTVDVKNYGHAFEGVHYIIIGQHPKYGTSQFYLEHAINNKYDLVFIDGNHEYESVKNDFLHANMMATKAIAFHDVKGLRGCEGVKEFMVELALSDFGKRCKTIIDTDDRIASGIGWIEL